MKISILELRDMVAGAISEAKRGKRAPKEVPQRTPESEAEQRDRQVRGTGYSHADVLDFSRPLGPANIVKRQGASGMGNWTSESAQTKILRKIHEMQIRKLVRMIVAEEIGADE